MDAEGAILMNVTSKRPIVSKGGLLYNVVDAETSGELRCGTPPRHARAPSRLVRALSR